MDGGHIGRDDPTDSMQHAFYGSAEPTLKPGDVLEDRFEIVQFLARGGMGEVYQAADLQMQGKHLALKTLRREGTSDSVMRQRFEREALLAREISTPTSVPLTTCSAPKPRTARCSSSP